MNRYFQAFLFSVMLLPLVPMLSPAQTTGDTFVENGYTFTVLSNDEEGGTVELTSAEPVSGYLSLPSIVAHEEKTFSLVAIGDEAFRSSAITDLDLTDATSLQRIGQSAFAECHDLTNVLFPAREQSSLTEIGMLAFHHCSSLASFNLEDTRIRVLETLFSKNQRDEIEFSNLTSLRLPSSLRTIKKFALQFLNITEIEIPSGVTTVEDCVLQGCIYLKDVTWKNAQVTRIPTKMFLGDDVLQHVTILTVDPMESDGLTDRHFFMCDKDSLQVFVTPESYENLVSGGYTNDTSIYSTLVSVTDWSPAQKGDANGDGSVNAADIVEVVNYIMGSESDGFLLTAADANSDGTVNAADIVSIVNTIMSVQ